MLLTKTNQKTMNSLDLMKIVNSCRESAGEKKIRANDFASRIVDELEGEHYESFVVENQNATTTTCFNLTIDQCVLVGMRESKSVRRLVRDKLKELEQAGRPALPDFSNPVEAARAWADAKEAEQEALEKLEEARPAVEFIGKYVESSGNKTFRQVAKLLKEKEPALRLFLVENKIMYRLGNEWTPYACHIDAGRFHVTTGTKNDHAYTTAKFTPKGVEWIAKLWGAQ